MIPACPLFCPLSSDLLPCLHVLSAVLSCLALLPVLSPVLSCPVLSCHILCPLSSPFFDLACHVPCYDLCPVLSCPLSFGCPIPVLSCPLSCRILGVAYIVRNDKCKIRNEMRRDNSKNQIQSNPIWGVRGGGSPPGKIGFVVSWKLVTIRMPIVVDSDRKVVP